MREDANQTPNYLATNPGATSDHFLPPLIAALYPGVLRCKTLRRRENKAAPPPLCMRGQGPRHLLWGLTQPVQLGELAGQLLSVLFPLLVKKGEGSHRGLSHSFQCLLNTYYVPRPC